jgi:hypothetical protein
VDIYPAPWSVFGDINHIRIQIIYCNSIYIY